MAAIKEYKKLISRFPELEQCSRDILGAYEIIAECYRNDNFLFTCGNGGSAADADHMVGEILKGFVLKRPMPEDEKAILAKIGGEEGALMAEKLQMGFRAMSLMSQTAIYTAVSNDLGGDYGPAQQLNSLGRNGDVLLGITTSGNSRNVILACHVAKLRGMKIIGMTGEGGGKLAQLADVCIKVPRTETYQIQELHLPVYHALCIMIEKTFFKI